MSITRDNALMELLLALVLFIVAIMIWGSVLTGLGWFLSFGNPYPWAVGLVLSLNAAHFFFGFFHVSSNFADIGSRGLMTSIGDYWRIAIRIVAILTIGPSVHTRRAFILNRNGS